MQQAKQYEREIWPPQPQMN